MSTDRFTHLVGKYVLVQTTVPWFAVIKQQGKPIMVFEGQVDETGKQVGPSMPRPFPFVRGEVKSATATDLVLKTSDLGDDSGRGVMLITVPLQYVAFVNEVEEPSPIIFGRPS